MGRKIYKVPTTELFRVELEGTFASSIVQADPESQVTIGAQEVNTINGDNFTSSWNDGEWK